MASVRLINATKGNTQQWIHPDQVTAYEASGWNCGSETEPEVGSEPSAEVESTDDSEQEAGDAASNGDDAKDE